MTRSIVNWNNPLGKWFVIYIYIKNLKNIHAFDFVILLYLWNGSRCIICNSETLQTSWMSTQRITKLLSLSLWILIQPDSNKNNSRVWRINCVAVLLCVCYMCTHKYTCVHDQTCGCWRLMLGVFCHSLPYFWDRVHSHWTWSSLFGQKIPQNPSSLPRTQLQDVPHALLFIWVLGIQP